MTKKKKKNIVEIIEVCNLYCAYRENAEKIAIALISSGYFATIRRNDGVCFCVSVYKDPNLM
jgi:hypothetical protein